MKESNFFEVLLRSAREKSLNIFMSLPPKFICPAWECELLHLRENEQQCLLHLQFKGYFNDLKRDQHLDEMQKLKGFLNTHSFVWKGIKNYGIKCGTQKFPSREKGTVQTVLSEWEFLLRYC